MMKQSDKCFWLDRYLYSILSREAFAWGIIVGGAMTTLAWLWFG